MANRLTYNKILRVIHLYLSMVLLLFALLYFVTGFVVSKHNWFPQGKDVKVTQVVPLIYRPDTTNLEQFGREIKQQFDISGRMNYSRNMQKEIIYSFSRPGMRHTVVVHANLDSLSITRFEKMTLGEVSKRIHRLHGFNGGTLYLIWAILLDLVAVSMILFSITGILLWLRARKLRTYGLWILIPTVVLAIVMFIFLS